MEKKKENLTPQAVPTDEKLFKEWMNKPDKSHFKKWILAKNKEVAPSVETVTSGKKLANQPPTILNVIPLNATVPFYYMFVAMRYRI